MAQADRRTALAKPLGWSLVIASSQSSVYVRQYQVPGILHILVTGTWYPNGTSGILYIIRINTYGYFTASLSRAPPQQVLHAALVNAPCRYSSLVHKYILGVILRCDTRFGFCVVSHASYRYDTTSVGIAAHSAVVAYNFFNIYFVLKNGMYILHENI